MSDPNVPGDIPGAAGGAPRGAAQAGGQQQLSEDEMREYLAQLRQGDVTEILAQAFSMLASAAEVKLGRRDARLLIDTVAAIADAVEPHLDERLTDQMRQAVSQLREAQVDAEGQLQRLREEGRLPREEDNDLPREGRAAAAEGDEGSAEEGTPPSGQQRGPQQGGTASDRLWIPGR